MEKELVINGVKYVQVEEKAEKEDTIEASEEKYKIVNYKGYNWYVIEKDREKAVLFMQDKLSPEEMKELFDEELLDSDKDVKFSNNGKNIFWCDSLIRMVLNSKFLSGLNRNDLIEMETTIQINDKKNTTHDYVRLITEAEVKRLPKEILKSKYSYGYWTMSPSLMNMGFDAYGLVVSSTGALVNFNVAYGYGVRPVITLKSNILGSLELDTSSAKVSE